MLWESRASSRNNVGSIPSSAWWLCFNWRDCMASNVVRIKITVREEWWAARPDACALFQRSGDVVVAEISLGAMTCSYVVLHNFGRSPVQGKTENWRYWAALACRAIQEEETDDCGLLHGIIPGRIVCQERRQLCRESNRQQHHSTAPALNVCGSGDHSSSQQNVL